MTKRSSGETRCTETHYTRTLYIQDLLRIKDETHEEHPDVRQRGSERLRTCVRTCVLPPLLLPSVLCIHFFLIDLLTPPCLMQSLKIGANTREYQGESYTLTFLKIPPALAGNTVGKSARIRRAPGSRESSNVFAPVARSSPRSLASLPSPYLDDTHTKLFGKWCFLIP